MIVILFVIDCYFVCHCHCHCHCHHETNVDREWFVFFQRYLLSLCNIYRKVYDCNWCEQRKLCVPPWGQRDIYRIGLGNRWKCAWHNFAFYLQTLTSSKVRSKVRTWFREVFVPSSRCNFIVPSLVLYMYTYIYLSLCSVLFLHLYSIPFHSFHTTKQL